MQMPRESFPEKLSLKSASELENHFMPLQYHFFRVFFFTIRGARKHFFLLLRNWEEEIKVSCTTPTRRERVSRWRWLELQACKNGKTKIKTAKETYVGEGKTSESFRFRRIFNDFFMALTFIVSVDCLALASLILNNVLDKSDCFFFDEIEFLIIQRLWKINSLLVKLDATLTCTLQK